MKKHIIILLCVMLLMLTLPKARAQVPVASAFTGLIKKVIVALDIKVQRLQNRTIALQNAEQEVENTLHLNSLNGINDWLGKEKTLYADYYGELAKVRRLIADYDVVKKMISQQTQLVREYRNANALFHRDAHFSADELKYMGDIYNGILKESVRNLDATITVVSDLATQMNDAERLERISNAAKAMQTNLDHLRQFNRQNAWLSMMRAKDERDRTTVKQLYNIQ